MAISDSVQECVANLCAAKTDTEKFAALFMVTKLTKSTEYSTDAKKLLFDSIGVDFLKKLLLCTPNSPPQVYKSVALSILSSFCTEPELAHHPGILSVIPAFFEIVQQSDTDDYEDNLMIIKEAYECLSNIALTEKGRKALIDQGAVVKMADIYSLQSFKTDEALQILVTLVQHFGPMAWDKQDPKVFNSLMNKVSLDFKTDHSERKFQLCGVMQALIAYCDHRTVRQSCSDESWPTSIAIGLHDILTSVISKAQRDAALKLASVSIELLGVDWAIGCRNCTKPLYSCLVHLSTEVVRQQLENKSFDEAMESSELITSCFIMIASCTQYIAGDSLDLDMKERTSLYDSLKDAYIAIINIMIKKFDTIPQGQETKVEKAFLCALIRVLMPWLAQVSSSSKYVVYDYLSFILSIANETFYSYRSRYIADKNNLSADSSPPVWDTAQVDILRLTLPALRFLSVEDKPRKIMLDAKEDEVLLEYFSFHWSIFNYKRPPIPKSERLKAKKEPLPELPSDLIDDMNDSKEALVCLCNIFMNILVSSERKFVETSQTFASLLKFILNNLTELKNVPENLVLHGNMCVLGLLILKLQSKKVKMNDFSICRYIQSTIRFLWGAYNVDESNDGATLVVSMAYKKYWTELKDLWFLGMEAMGRILPLIPWISEFAVETGWVHGIADDLYKVKEGGLPDYTVYVFEDFLCDLVDRNENVASILNDHDALTVCRKHKFNNLGFKLFGYHVISDQTISDIPDFFLI